MNNQINSTIDYLMQLLFFDVYAQLDVEILRQFYTTTNHFNVAIQSSLSNTIDDENSGITGDTTTSSDNLAT